MHNNHLIAVCIFIAVCCSSCFLFPTEKANSNQEESHNVESLKGKLQKNYRPDGSLLSTITYQGNQRHGLAHNYYPNGQIQSSIPYDNNKKHGEVIWYYKSAKIYRTTPYVEGQKHGVRKVYYEDGSLQATQSFKKNLPQSDLTEYTPLGDKVSNYTDWNYQIVDKRNLNRYVDVVFTFNKKVKHPAFFHNVKRKNDTVRMPVSRINGRQFLRIPLKPGVKRTENISIIGQYRTPYHNTFVSEKKILVHVK